MYKNSWQLCLDDKQQLFLTFLITFVIPSLFCRQKASRTFSCLDLGLILDLVPHLITPKLLKRKETIFKIKSYDMYDKCEQIIKVVSIIQNVLF